MRRFFRRLYIRWFKPYRSLEVRFATYSEADKLMKADKRWELHTKLEDKNTLIGFVWIEKREYLKD